MKEKLLLLILCIIGNLFYYSNYYKQFEVKDINQGEFFYLNIEGYSVNKLTEKQLKEAKKLFDKAYIYEFYSPEYDKKTLSKYKEEYYSYLIDKELKVPFYNFQIFLLTIKNEILNEDYMILEKNGKKLEKEKRAKYKYLLNTEIQNILKKYGYDYDLIDELINEQMTELALYNVNADKISLADESCYKEDKISLQEKELYEKCFSFSKMIIPEKFYKMIGMFRIYTDGYYNSLAYVSMLWNEKYMISMDIKDTFTNKGKIKKKS